MANSAVVGFLRAILVADTAQFDAEMRRVSNTADKTAKDLGGIGKQATNVGRALTQTLTLPLVAAGASVAKLAMNFESSFAGVRKTVEATEAEFVGLALAFRQLAKEIPINVNELNKIGEAAGALGIAKGDILAFTKTIALLGVTTNLSSEQAADAVARIQNIFGAAGKDTDRLASTLVALGNAGASTEKEIVEMAQRIAGAGHTVRLTQAQVLAFASTLASVGINAEAGGSAISRIFLKMNDAVMKGGDGLKEFARVAGVSSRDFKKSFETDAGQATIQFINGLARLRGEGENINQTIEGLVGKNIILKDTLFRLSGAGNELSRQMGVANRAWRENTALTEEARKRFETTEAQLTLFWNRIKDVGITLGNAFLPAIKAAISVLEGGLPVLENMVKAFTNMPTAMQLGVIGLGLVVAAIGPLLWAMGTLITSTSTVIGAFGRKGIASRALTALLREQTIATEALTAAQLRNAGAAAASSGAGARAGLATAAGFASRVALPLAGVGLALAIASRSEIPEAAPQPISASMMRSHVPTTVSHAGRSQFQLPSFAGAGTSSSMRPVSSRTNLGPVTTPPPPPPGGDGGGSGEVSELDKAIKGLVNTLTGQAVRDRIAEIAGAIAAMGGTSKIAAEQLPGLLDELKQYEAVGYRLPPTLNKLVNENRALSDLFPKLGSDVTSFSDKLPNLADGAKASTAHMLGMAASARAFEDGAKNMPALLKAGAINVNELADAAKRAADERNLAKFATQLSFAGAIISEIGRNATGAFGATFNVISHATNAAFDYVVAMKAAKLANDSTAASAAAMNMALSAATIGIGLVAQAWGAFSAASAKSRAELQQLRDDLREFGFELEDIVDLSGLNRLRQRLVPEDEREEARAFLDDWKKRMGELSSELDRAASGLRDFGGKAPAALQPLIRQLLESTRLTAEQRRLLEGMSGSPHWRDLQQRAEELGIELSSLGDSFNAARIKDIAFGYARDLQMFQEAGADTDGVLRGMADELSALSAEAAKTGKALPKQLEPFIGRLREMGLLVDENGNAIEGFSFAEMKDDSLEAVKDVLEEIRDLLANVLPKAAGSFGRALEGLAAPARGIWSPRMPGFDSGNGDRAPFFGSGMPVVPEGWERLFSSGESMAPMSGSGVTVNVQTLDPYSFEKWLRAGGADAIARTLPDATDFYVGRR